MKNLAVTISKLEESTINEDAIIARENLIAVSDGAGGGGVYAERWSSYLVNHLPEVPIKSFDELDGWIEDIWETFYNDCEENAKQEGGMLLDKFYDEGSFATLAVIWKENNATCRWLTYGDSVVFHYNKNTKTLEHSFSKLADFTQPPYLINCKDELNPLGLKSGTFQTNDSSILFVATDALSHYILMMYEVSQKDEYKMELQNAINNHSKNGILIKNALQIKTLDFEKDVLNKLLNCKIPINIKRHISAINRKGLIGHDDYTFAAFT